MAVLLELYGSELELTSEYRPIVSSSSLSFYGDTRLLNQTDLVPINPINIFLGGVIGLDNTTFYPAAEISVYLEDGLITLGDIPEYTFETNSSLDSTITILVSSTSTTTQDGDSPAIATSILATITAVEVQDDNTLTFECALFNGLQIPISIITKDMNPSSVVSKYTETTTILLSPTTTTTIID